MPTRRHALPDLVSPYRGLIMRRFALVTATFVCVQLMSAQVPSSHDGMPRFSPVTWERLVNAADEPHNWLMYSGTLDSKRYSGLD